mmetsp:Transcript_14316/g.16412  ORF Transcript_14316/g.16412 Transcript_14316/m.16412 type:complete len:140 (+) Transcript_14316:1096-1515(+)
MSAGLRPSGTESTMVRPSKLHFWVELLLEIYNAPLSPPRVITIVFSVTPGSMRPEEVTSKVAAEAVIVIIIVVMITLIIEERRWLLRRKIMIIVDIDLIDSSSLNSNPTPRLPSKSTYTRRLRILQQPTTTVLDKRRDN